MWTQLPLFPSLAPQPVSSLHTWPCPWETFSAVSQKPFPEHLQVLFPDSLFQLPLDLQFLPLHLGLNILLKYMSY